MNQYPNYGYYGQPMYPPHGAMPMAHPGYPPFYPQQPHPSQQLPPGPAPVPFDTDPYVNMNAPTPPKEKKSRRRSAPSASAPAPLKSAMKKPAATQIMATPIPQNTVDFPGSYGSNGYPLARQRTNSIGYRPNEPRGRTHSNVDHGGIDPPFQPLHMFISFHGYNELRVENITELALKELREKIWPLWRDGIESLNPGSETIVKFRNQPWDMSGPNYLVALQMIQQLFTLCCRRGFSFQTAMNIGHQQVPRLIFVVDGPDPNSEFFLAFFSSSGRRLSIVNPPSHIDLSLPAQLKAALPRKINTDFVEHEALRIIEVKRKANSAPEVEPSLFLAHVLKILSGLGYELNFTVPLAKKTQLGLRGAVQEVMVFKGIPPPG